jgi:hypothetical protein
MSTLHTTPATIPGTDRGVRTEDTSTTRVLPMLGGLSLIAAPFLLAVAGYTSPPATGDSNAAYIASLADDPVLTAISANFFHYSWVLFAFGALAAVGLVRGRRGRGLTTWGALTGAFGSIQISGLLLNDWHLSALGRHLTIEQAVEVFETTTAAPSIGVWLGTGQVLSFVGFPLLYAGLARAGAISWWLVPLAPLPLFAFAVLGGVLGVVVGTACSATAFVTGYRLVQRARLGG